jgi:hypothetical protein
VSETPAEITARLRREADAISRKHRKRRQKVRKALQEAQAEAQAGVKGKSG